MATVTTKLKLSQARKGGLARPAAQPGQAPIPTGEVAWMYSLDNSGDKDAKVKVSVTVQSTTPDLFNGKDDYPVSI